MINKGVISVYCKCEVCSSYFDVTGKKRSRFCGKKCRDKDFYRRKLSKKGGSNV